MRSHSAVGVRRLPAQALLQLLTELGLAPGAPPAPPALTAALHAVRQRLVVTDPHANPPRMARGGSAEFRFHRRIARAK